MSLPLAARLALAAGLEGGSEFLARLLLAIGIGLVMTAMVVVQIIAGILSGGNAGAGPAGLGDASLIVPAPGGVGIPRLPPEPPATGGRAVPTGRGLVPGWAVAPAMDQFDPINYSTRGSWATWQAYSCSAASLTWLLRAYGARVPFIDTAIDLIGPGSGIAVRIGLVDASGAPLVRAIARAGFTPRFPVDSAGRPRRLGSRAELQAWLAQGPLALSGDRWFGDGHWFVATAFDSDGIFIRDSSGHDTRYLTWARLYGEVGFSGAVVGVVP